jgi:hypothetical protein
MNIPDTLKALRDLANTLPHDGNDTADDLHEAEFLLASCEPALAPAAFSHCMALFVRLRERAVLNADVAMLREGVNRYGHCGQ